MFTLHYDADPDRVWAALQQAIDDMDGARLGPVRQDGRELEFETGVTLTSWGEFLQATVEPGSQPGRCSTSVGVEDTLTCASSAVDCPERRVRSSPAPGS